MVLRRRLSTLEARAKAVPKQAEQLLQPARGREAGGTWGVREESRG